jgi:alpha-1,2-mannosyltransferase
MRPHLKQPLLLLVLCVLFALMSSYRLSPSKYYRVRFARSVLGASSATLERSFGKDSWAMMASALHYWRVSGNERIYSELLIKQTRKYLYPPSALLIPKSIEDLHIPQDPFYAASTVFFLFVTVLASAGVALWALRAYGGIRPQWWERALIVLLAGLLALTFYPIVLGAVLGQLQVWLNALFAVSLLCYVTGRRISAGAALGLMALGKPQYALFLLWGLLRRDKRLVFGMLAAAAVGLGASIATFGLAMHLDYLRGLRFLSSHGESFHANQCVYGLLGRLYGVTQPDLFNNLDWIWNVYPPFRATLYAATLVSSIAFIALALLKGRAEPALESTTGYCQMALATTLAAPIAWVHHYGILLPIFALLWPLLWFDERFRHASRWRAAIVVCYILASSYISGVNNLAATWFNVLQSYLFFAVVTVFALLMYLRMRKPPTG